MNRWLLRALGILALAMLANAPALAADTVYYYYTDTLHSAAVITDAAGNVVERTYYAPYGQVLNRPLRDGPAYTGQYEDPVTGLDYMQHRYYDPQAGRFLSADPVLLTDAGGNFNRYWYAKDNPYRFTDPDGRNSIITYNPDGNITIQIPVNFTGPGATPSNVAIAKAEVASRWTGAYNVNGASTKVAVAITEVSSNTPKSAVNNIALLNGPTAYKATQGASFVKNFNKGEWNMTSPGIGEGEVAHEAGHLMGITKMTGDQYTTIFANGTRYTEPKAGYAHDLMDQLSYPGNSASPTSRDINNILRSPVNVVHKPPPPACHQGSGTC